MGYENIEKVLNNIVNEYLVNEKLIIEQHHSALDGIEGVLFFLVSYNKYYPHKKVQNLCNKIISKLVSDLSSSVNLKFNEIISIIEGLDYCNNLNFVDLDFDGSVLDSLININDSLIKTKNWDLLHGFLGLSCFLINHDKAKSKKIFVNQVNFLYKESSTKINQGYLFNNVILSETENINFGIAHGLPSIGILLSKFYKIGIDRVKSKKMAFSIINLLDKYYLFEKKQIAQYPNIYDLKSEKATYGREFGWCYGDISMILLNIHYYQNFGDEKFYNKAFDLAKRCANSSKEFTRINDPMFCHGSLGISYLFFKLFHFFKDEIFYVKHEEYLDYTLNNFYYNQNETFYKAVYSKSEVNGFYKEIDYGLLEGNAGIGLILLNFLHDDFKDWDYKFLTNI